MSNQTTNQHQKVYLVSTGVYSDHTIRAVCSSREKAEFIASKFEDANDIKEFEVDRLCDRAAQGLSTYTIVWEGDFKNVQNMSGEKGEIDNDDSDVKCAGINRYFCYVLARNSAHAIKIAQDRFIKWKANNISTIK